LISKFADYHRESTGGKKKLRVLDIGCGKGGDLGKWSKAGVVEYVGIGNSLFTKQ
jgi:mRNA (guanine-N7-)-methyltransferase